MNSEIDINTPEFWEQVKAEYKPNEGISGICHHSTCFSRVWRDYDIREQVHEHAKEFLKTWKGNCKGVGFSFLFCISDTTREEDIAIRHAFIDYMLEKTSKKDLAV